jgi:hypothetical protein
MKGLRLELREVIVESPVTTWVMTLELLGKSPLPLPGNRALILCVLAVSDVSVRVATQELILRGAVPITVLPS